MLSGPFECAHEAPLLHSADALDLGDHTASSRAMILMKECQCTKADGERVAVRDKTSGPRTLLGLQILASDRKPGRFVFQNTITCPPLSDAQRDS